MRGLFRCVPFVRASMRSTQRFVSELPNPPYTIPPSPLFDAERSGAFDPAWLLRLPELKPLARNAVYLPTKDVFWNAPTHEALELLATRLPYHDMLRYITEHNYDFLFEFLLLSRDAPMPHVVYEDFMKSRTFAALQRPPEEQFALSPALLRALLCAAAHHCTHDPHYFTSCELLFRRMNQQQSLGSAALSAWVHCCAAAGHVDLALAHARRMAAHGMPFDPTVFALLQHPALDPSRVLCPRAATGGPPVAARGLLVLRRLGAQLDGAMGAAAAAAHAVFVHYALTLQHARKWEVLRAAREQGVAPAQRTLALAVSAFAWERGVRCGPRAVGALAAHLARSGAVAELLYVLLRARCNAQVAALHALPPLRLDEAEAEALMRVAAGRGGRFEEAEPILRALVRGERPPANDGTATLIREAVAIEERAREGL